MAHFSCFIIRYVPDLRRGEFVNIGVLVRDMAEAQPPVVRFTSDWTRLLTFAPDADIEVLQSLEEDLKANLSKKPEDGAKPLIDTILDSFSNSLQISEGKGRSAESLDSLVEELMTSYVHPPVSPLLAMAAGA